MDETMLKFSNEPPDHLSTELMSLALDGLLESGEQREFHAHLQECEACRGQWLKWRRISDVFQVEPFRAPTPGFILRVDQAVLRDEKRRERLWGGLVLVGGTLSIWTILLMGLALTLTAGMTVSSGVRLDLKQLLGIGGLLVTSIVQDLTVIRDGLLVMLPDPAVTAGLVAVLVVLALIWLRLVRSSGRRSGVSGGQASTSANDQ